MARWKYRKPESTSIRGLCVRCNSGLQKRTSKGTFAAICRKCDNELYRSSEGQEKDRKRKNTGVVRRRRPYREFLKDTCENCGFVPEHPCQLDVDHIDEDHANNDLSNLQTLCANCHRLKTFKARWEKS